MDLNIAYGGGERQALDLFYPASKPRGLVVFIHGGYWIRFDRKMWSHFAAGAQARGWAVAMPSYTLAPEARISEIVSEVARAVAKSAELVRGPIVITGHSAGGHLAARMACDDVDLPADVLNRLKRVLPISPLTDLRPLRKLTMNADLQLSAEEAEAESPVLATPHSSLQVTTWVGAEERPVFLDHARWLAEAWPGSKLRIDPGRHHFDVIDGLQVADSPIMEALLGGLDS